MLFPLSFWEQLYIPIQWLPERCLVCVRLCFHLKKKKVANPQMRFWGLQGGQCKRPNSFKVLLFLYFLLNIILYFTYMGVLPIFMSAHHLQAWCLSEARRGHQNTWNWSYADCKPPYGHWELKLGSLEEQPVLFNGWPVSLAPCPFLLLAFLVNYKGLCALGRKMPPTYLGIGTCFPWLNVSPGFMGLSGHPLLLISS